jgi:hypothetical protein
MGEFGGEGLAGSEPVLLVRSQARAAPSAVSRSRLLMPKRQDDDVAAAATNPRCYSRSGSPRAARGRHRVRPAGADADAAAGAGDAESQSTAAAGRAEAGRVTRTLAAMASSSLSISDNRRPRSLRGHEQRKGVMAMQDSIRSLAMARLCGLSIIKSTEEAASAAGCRAG